MGDERDRHDAAARRAADAVDRLLDLLGAIDGDADFELTAVETHGGGFPPLAGSDDEDGLDAEQERLAQVGMRKVTTLVTPRNKAR